MLARLLLRLRPHPFSLGRDRADARLRTRERHRVRLAEMARLDPPPLLLGAAAQDLDLRPVRLRLEDDNLAALRDLVSVRRPLRALPGSLAETLPRPQHLAVIVLRRGLRRHEGQRVRRLRVGRVDARRQGRSGFVGGIGGVVFVVVLVVHRVTKVLVLLARDEALVARVVRKVRVVVQRPRHRRRGLRCRRRHCRLRLRHLRPLAPHVRRRGFRRLFVPHLHVPQDGARRLHLCNDRVRLAVEVVGKLHLPVALEGFGSDGEPDLKEVHEQQVGVEFHAVDVPGFEEEVVGVRAAVRVFLRHPVGTVLHLFEFGDVTHRALVEEMRAVRVQLLTLGVTGLPDVQHVGAASDGVEHVRLLPHDVLRQSGRETVADVHGQPDARRRQQRAVPHEAEHHVGEGKTGFELTGHVHNHLPLLAFHPPPLRFAPRVQLFVWTVADGKVDAAFEVLRLERDGLRAVDRLLFQRRHHTARAPAEKQRSLGPLLRRGQRAHRLVLSRPRHNALLCQLLVSSRLFLIFCHACREEAACRFFSQPTGSLTPMKYRYCSFY
eukprot:Rhum_TRINITY_DN20703_c0_g1::Rhum_TRINITY_DN20703_c0_g1_i1::g.171892::m.171892